MANVTINPWNFVSGDASLFTITGITEAASIATVTTSAPHGFVVNQKVSVAGAVPIGYNGIWNIIAVPSTTTFTYQVIGVNGLPLTGLGNTTTGGNTGAPAWLQQVRAEQIIWQNPGASQTLVVTDALGNPIWEVATGASDNIPNSYSYSKPFWVRGIWLQQITAGVLTITVN